MNERLVANGVDRILQRIHGEYLEMPGLRLTRAQARRLWGLDEATCAHVLESLTEDGFLYRRDDGTYARRTDGPAFLPGADGQGRADTEPPLAPRAAVRSR